MIPASPIAVTFLRAWGWLGRRLQKLLSVQVSGLFTTTSELDSRVTSRASAEPTCLGTTRSPSPVILRRSDDSPAAQGTVPLARSDRRADQHGRGQLP